MSSINYFVHESSIVDEGCQIGEGTKIWHFCHLMQDCKIGQFCVLGQNVMVAPKVVLGDYVKVQNNVSLYTGVICADEVFIGPSVVFTNVINPRSRVNRKAEFRSTLVEKGASIGANATIICGYQIGAYAMIGAGAVVTQSIKPYALVVGNPARQIGWVSESGMRLHFDEKHTAICPETGDSYQLMGETVQKNKS